MQLIMDTEPSMDITDKMSTIEEPLNTNLKDPVESLKNEIANGNKENIDAQKNILDNAVDAVNGESVKCSNEPSPTPVSTDNVASVIEEEKGNGDIDVKTDEANEKNVCETSHSNGAPTTSETDGDKEMCKENSEQEEVTKVNSIVTSEELTNLEKDIIMDDNNLENDRVKVANNVKNDTAKTLDNTNDDHIVEEIESTSQNSMGDICMDTECLKPVLQEAHVKDVVDKVPVETEEKSIDLEILDSETEKNIIIQGESKSLDLKTEEIKEDAMIKILDAEEKNDSAAIKDVQTAEDVSEINSVSEILDTDANETKNNDEPVIVTENIDNYNEGSPVNKDVALSENNTTEQANEDTATVLSQNEIEQKSDVHPEINSIDDVLNCDDVVESNSVQNKAKDDEEILDVDEFLRDTDNIAAEPSEEETIEEKDEAAKTIETKKAPICKLSNTLDILSDDEEESSQSEPPKEVTSVTNAEPTEKQCISIEVDDDDIMLIDEEDGDSKDSKGEPVQPMETDEKKEVEETVEKSTIDLESNSVNTDNKKLVEALPEIPNDSPLPETETISTTDEPTCESKLEKQEEKIKEIPKKPLVAENFLKGYKKNLADMTREDLEEFCILKIVESIVDRSNLSDIKSKLKAMAQTIEDYKKKAMMLTKQNRDLQLVLKSVQEEQKKKSDQAVIPLKITRSVGMQVLMTEKTNTRKPVQKSMPNTPTTVNNTVNTNVNNVNKVNNRTTTPSPRAQKSTTNSQQIPVPRLVPANSAVKTPNATSNTNNNTPKNTNQSGLNGLKVAHTQKTAEKRTHNKVQSVTVDLTDDEPPTKVTPRSSPAPPVRLVSPQNLLTRPQFTQGLNSPRKVYIPISGPQSQNIRPGQTIMLKSVPPPGQRLKGPAPHTARMPQNQVRLTRVQNNRHPAPLPECMRQYQPPNWKALPPAPDLKLSKVENGIVISWKIEGYQEDSYEDIASYQLYAYQETSSPPSTALWKKIGDVKALPLPMACTLTQFMSGFKYYFAVRAVDVKSRLGPFSLPGSILLLNKM